MPPAKLDDDYTPPFARPTATKKIKDRMRDADVVVKNDESNNLQQAQVALEDHEDVLRQEKVSEPTRFLPNSTANRGTGHLRVAPRKVAHAEFSGPSVQFKKVQVKQLDESVAQLRAAHSLSSGRMGDSSSNKSMQSMQSTVQGNAAASVAFANVKPSIDLLNSCVKGNLDPTIVTKFNPRKDSFLCFVEDLNSIDDRVSSKIFKLINSKLGSSIADNCLASPKEFWTFFNLCWTGITRVKASSMTFKSLVALLESIGTQMVLRDPYVPFALFLDFGVPKMFDVLRRDASKLPGLTRLIFAFSVKDAEEHVKVIRVLKEGLDDFPTLIRCLSILIALETNFSAQSLDLYLYYIIAGFKHSSPTVRSTCVHMLASIATASDISGHNSVFSVLDDLEAMCNDTWQVKCAVVHVHCALVAALPAQDPRCSQLYKTIERLVSEKGSPLVARAGLVYMSQCVTAQHFVMRDMFTDMLNNNPEVAGPALSPPAHAWSEQPRMCDFMNRVAVAQLVSEQVRGGQMDNLTPPLVKLLSACVEEIGQFPANEADQWRAVFQGLGNHLLVEFTDPKFCDAVSTILLTFFTDPSTTDAARELLEGDGSGDDAVGPLYGVLKLLFADDDGDRACQQAVVNFLSRLSSSSDFSSAVSDLLATFSKFEADKYGGSLLQELAESLGP